MGRDELGGPGWWLWLHRGHYSGVPAGPSKLVTQLTPWHSSQVFEGKLVSQLWGIKLFGPDSEITIWKSSLSLSVTPQFLITWERCWPFLLASIKPVLGRSLAGGPGTAQGAEQSNTCPFPWVSTPKSPSVLCRSLFVPQLGLPRMAMPDPGAQLLGLQWARSHGWPRLAVLVETASAALPQPHSPRWAVRRPSALQWNKLTWQEHSNSSKASGGERHYDSSVKDFQLE